MSKMHKGQILKTAHEFRAAMSVTDTAIFDFLLALDTPRSLTVWLLYSNKEHQQLVDLKVSPSHYCSVTKFRDDYQATEFLSKSDFLKLEVSKSDAAFAKFFEFEDHCSHVNSRFRNLSSDPSYTGQNVWLLHALTRKIEEILGEYDPEEFIDDANWGPGVTTLLKGCHVSATNKFHFESGMTQQLYSFVKPWFAMAYPLWGRHLDSNQVPDFTRQQGNLIVTVPKNSKTDRVIAVEPGINLWFQKAIGTMIRKRLRRVGVNLNSQERNQQLAYLSSKNDKLATVDFSSASDSISRELVRCIIPSRWLSLMEATRCTNGIHNNTSIHWQKFSSMGNGFTFELESLIFYAAALVVKERLQVEGSISVFGDDVILPSSCYELFSLFSEFLGFKVNTRKSFSQGYFRESCGSHYYNGTDCKPLYLKERLRNVQHFYKLANGIRILSHRCNSYCSCDRRFRFVWSSLVQRVPKSLRLFVPAGLGDSGFAGNFDESTPERARHGIEGYYVGTLVEPGVSQDFEGEGLLLARLKAVSVSRSITNYLTENLSVQAYKNCYTLRGRTKLKITKSLVAQWYNLGGWE